KRDGNDSQWIDSPFEELQVHLDQLAGLAGPRAGPNDGVNFHTAGRASDIRTLCSPACRPDRDAPFLYALFPSDLQFAREHHRKPSDRSGTRPPDCQANEAADTGLPLAHIRRRQERAEPDTHRSEPERTLSRFSRLKRMLPST